VVFPRQAGPTVDSVFLVGRFKETTQTLTTHRVFSFPSTFFFSFSVVRPGTFGRTLAHPSLSGGKFSNGSPQIFSPPTPPLHLFRIFSFFSSLSPGTGFTSHYFLLNIFLPFSPLLALCSNGRAFFFRGHYHKLDPFSLKPPFSCPSLCFKETRPPPQYQVFPVLLSFLSRGLGSRVFAQFTKTCPAKTPSLGILATKSFFFLGERVFFPPGGTFCTYGAPVFFRSSFHCFSRGGTKKPNRAPFPPNGTSVPVCGKVLNYSTFSSWGTGFFPGMLQFSLPPLSVGFGKTGGFSLGGGCFPGHPKKPFFKNFLFETLPGFV